MMREETKVHRMPWLVIVRPSADLMGVPSASRGPVHLEILEVGDTFWHLLYLLAVEYYSKVFRMAQHCLPEMFRRQEYKGRSPTHLCRTLWIMRHLTLRLPTSKEHSWGDVSGNPFRKSFSIHNGLLCCLVNLPPGFPDVAEKRAFVDHQADRNKKGMARM